MSTDRIARLQALADQHDVNTWVRNYGSWLADHEFSADLGARGTSAPTRGSAR
ncbi:hypothetical protein [Nocardia camponoti]|uniref:Uncharacterized protein n=1 Tax=Nocardia camponoti TaxID=1616106 RepID=A0A917QV75_9NOCA|nr:hypothetical protein [Nocardia camponoti]GGK69305.1 hypothetical protein GCM10011591_46770 [Nocardia camponoti]